jgi:transposase-like protein
MSEQVGGRAVPYYCPFCGDEDLRPHQEDTDSPRAHGGWLCGACRRVFTVSMTGLMLSGVTR